MRFDLVMQHQERFVVVLKFKLTNNKHWRNIPLLTKEYLCHVLMHIAHMFHIEMESFGIAERFAEVVDGVGFVHQEKIV
jgi:hypothetical protein